MTNPNIWRDNSVAKLNGRLRSRLSNTSHELAVISERIKSIGLYLPFFSLFVFFASHLINSQVSSVPHVFFFQKQWDFLESKGSVEGLNIAFAVFEIFIVIACVVGILRLVTGLTSIEVMNSFKKKFDLWRQMKRSIAGLIFAATLIGPFSLFCATNFEFVLYSDQARALLKFSPRGFVSFETFIFCTGVIFSVESLLFVFWFLFFRKLVNGDNRLKDS